MSTLAAIIFRTLLITTFALWFGGFTFYVSFVVPIGNEVLGSVRSQGFITQQVTHWLNLVCGSSILLMLIESFRRWKCSPVRWRSVQLAMVLIIGGLLIALVLIHPVMDEMIVVEEEMITDEIRFYGLHRIYLWVSTIQWVAAWIWILVAVADWRREDRLQPAVG